MREPLQDKAELAEFITFVRDENVRMYLEIGSKFGGSLWAIGNAMPRGSLIVAIDIEAKPELRATIEQLKGRGYNAKLIVGNSTDQSVVEVARAYAPYDLCLIDANHTEPFVRCDWKNYGPMARIVAFHDIGWIEGERRPAWKIDVPKVWNEIKLGFHHREIKLCHTKRDNGIGILWH